MVSPPLLLPSFSLLLLLIYSLILHQPFFKNTTLTLSVLASERPSGGKIHPPHF